MEWLHGRFEFAKYFIASLVGLSADLAAFSLCIRALHLGLSGAVVVGFLVGALVAYLFSAFWVFPVRTYRCHPLLEFSIFFATGLLGVLVTRCIIYLGVEVLSFSPELVKLLSSAITFLINFMVRKVLLFSRHGAREVMRLE
ncbi:GtrA family protein [Pseudomonas sp. AU12215]|uniref:GtrA family protein n=1 Tax=Pseudomonas sp. AU12215 TaxID=1860123 RepID=UPI00159EF062|nr:GtrA family protein [Pseudomonas sp. AU12215]